MSHLQHPLNTLPAHGNFSPCTQRKRRPVSQLPLQLWCSHVTWAPPISHPSETQDTEESKVRKGGCVESTFWLGWQGDVRFGLSSPDMFGVQGPGSGTSMAQDSAAKVRRAPARPVEGCGHPSRVQPQVFSGLPRVSGRYLGSLYLFLFSLNQLE